MISPTIHRMASKGNVELEMSAGRPFLGLPSSIVQVQEEEDQEPGAPGANPKTAEFYSLKHQRYHLCFKKFCRWGVTVLFTVFIVATLMVYEKKGNFSSGHKIAFNTITTGLLLGWGLNLFVSHSPMKVSACSLTGVN